MKKESSCAVADPTHVRFFDKQTFKYFCENKSGIKRWRPLIVFSSDDTIFADLSPIKKREAQDQIEFARWFF